MTVHRRRRRPPRPTSCRWCSTPTPLEHGSARARRRTATTTTARRPVYDALHDKEVTAPGWPGIADAAHGRRLALPPATGRRRAPAGRPSLVIGGRAVQHLAGLRRRRRSSRSSARSQPGLNPDIEMHAGARRGGQHGTSPSRSGTARDRATPTGEPRRLAMLQAFLRDATDGWELATTSVRDLYAEADLHADEVGGDFAGEARAARGATAEVHADLAAALPHRRRSSADELAGTRRPACTSGSTRRSPGCPSWRRTPTALRAAYDDARRAAEPGVAGPARPRRLPPRPGAAHARTAGCCSTSRASRPGRWPSGARSTRPLRDVAGHAALASTTPPGTCSPTSPATRSARTAPASGPSATGTRSAPATPSAAGRDPREDAVLLRASRPTRRSTRWSTRPATGRLAADPARRASSAGQADVVATSPPSPPRPGIPAEPTRRPPVPPRAADQPATRPSRPSLRRRPPRPARACSGRTRCAGGVAVRTLRPRRESGRRCVTGSDALPARRTPRAACSVGGRCRCDGVTDYRLEVDYGGGPVREDDPYRFLPTLGEMDLHLDRRGPPRAAVGGARRARPRATTRRSAPSPAPRSPSGRPTPGACGSSATSTTGTAARTRCARSARPASGSCSCPASATARATSSRSSAPTACGGEKADPMALRDRGSRRPPPRSSSPPPTSGSDEDWLARAGHGRPAHGADVHLRGAPRLVAPGPVLPGAGRRAGRLRRATSASRTSSSCRWPSTRSAAPGATRSPSYYAPTARFGSPDDFRYLVDRLHQAGIGVIVDWVPGALPEGRLGAGPLRRHARCTSTPTRGAASSPTGAPTSSTSAAREVRNFLVANARVLARGVPHRRPAGRRRRLDALPRLLAARTGEWVPNSLRRPGEPRGGRVPAGDERHRLQAGRPAWSRSPRSPRPGRASPGRPTSAVSASASSGTWAGCTTRSTTSPTSRSTASTTTTR